MNKARLMVNNTVNNEQTSITAQKHTLTKRNKCNFRFNNHKIFFQSPFIMMTTASSPQTRPRSSNRAN